MKSTILVIMHFICCNLIFISNVYAFIKTPEIKTYGDYQIQDCETLTMTGNPHSVDFFYDVHGKRLNIMEQQLIEGGTYAKAHLRFLVHEFNPSNGYGGLHNAMYNSYNSSYYLDVDYAREIRRDRREISRIRRASARERRSSTRRSNRHNRVNSTNSRSNSRRRGRR